MVAFGWSIGDIAAATKILIPIANGLDEMRGAASQFQQVVRDFNALRTVVEFIEDLCPNDAEFSVAQALCARSQSSQHVLVDFLASVTKYDKSLGGDSGSKWHRGTLRKSQWALFMSKEVQKLQDVIGPQIQSIDLLLHARQL